MQSESGVEWELVDYGPGVFHVVSYHDKPVADAVAPLDGLLELTSPAKDAAVPDCFFYRCWSALREGCRAT